MILHKQTKLVSTHANGNCYPTVIATLLQCNPEDVPSFENLYFHKRVDTLRAVYEVFNKELREDSFLKDKQTDMYFEAMNLWITVLNTWLASHGYIKRTFFNNTLQQWLKDNPDKLYGASGKSSRGVDHIVIYKNGVLFHDPHPSDEGLIAGSEYEYEWYEKVI